MYKRGAAPLTYLLPLHAWRGRKRVRFLTIVKETAHKQKNSGYIPI
jgi:hypothetical protein